MKFWTMIASTLLITTTQWLPTPAASAPAAAMERDHDRARQALTDGSIMPLSVILAKVQEQYPGQVLEVELESPHRHPRVAWIYEIKILSPNGQLSKLKVDARNGEVLASRSRVIDRMRER